MASVTLSVDSRQYKGDFPHFARPNQFGEYSINRERKIKLGRLDAKYFFEKAKGVADFDLNKGYDTFESKDDGDERLDMLLDWLIAQSPDGSNLKKILRETDVLCWRGLLTKIACTPYNTREMWKFNAIRQKDVIFLCEEKTEQKIMQEARMSDRDKLMSYWGYKFEQYVTVDTLKSFPNLSRVVSNKEEFTVVARSEIRSVSGRQNNSIKLAYGAEVDAIDKDGNIIEIKTQRQELNQGFHRNKSLKWWLQSFLIGISDIVVGFRDDNGIVFKVDTLRVDSIPQQGQWEGAVCLNFLSTVLLSVKNLLVEDGMKCECLFDLSQVTIQVTSSSPDFLSPSFKQHFNIPDAPVY